MESINAKHPTEVFHTPCITHIADIAYGRNLQFKMGKLYLE